MQQRTHIRDIRRLALLLWLVLLVLWQITSASHPVSCRCSPTRSSLEHIYAVDVSASYGSTSTHFEGIQTLALRSLQNNMLTGCVTWNLSWDGGETWLFLNTTYAYAVDRTYQNQNVTLFTAWWIDATVQLGDRIVIQGEPPATDYFLRDGPFLVTEVASLTLDSGRYACWLLTYETLDGQQERFYYERWTGLLVAAYSSQTNPPSQSQQVRLELLTAKPPLPPEDLFTHLWLSFGPTLVSLSIAVLVAVGTYRLLARLGSRRLEAWLDGEPKHNA